jgi:hypothetical protein
VRDLEVNGQLTVRPGAEREAFDKSMKMYGPLVGALVWDDDKVRLAEPDVPAMQNSNDPR